MPCLQAAVPGFQKVGKGPGVLLIHFPTAKHWVLWDAPEPFLVALRAFEAGLGR